MPASSDPRTEVLAFFETRFGVNDALDGLHFIERNDELWATSACPPPGLDAERPAGLRILRRQPRGLKPTSVVLMLLGDRITRSRVDVDRDELRDLLLGQRIRTDTPIDDGPVALVHRGDVIGCGRLARGELRALIPTGRRRELLGALDVPS